VRDAPLRTSWILIYGDAAPSTARPRANRHLRSLRRLPLDARRYPRKAHSPLLPAPSYNFCFHAFGSLRWPVITRRKQARGSRVSRRCRKKSTRAVLGLLKASGRRSVFRLRGRTTARPGTPPSSRMLPSVSNNALSEDARWPIGWRALACGNCCGRMDPVLRHTTKISPHPRCVMRLEAINCSAHLALAGRVRALTRLLNAILSGCEVGVARLFSFALPLSRHGPPSNWRCGTDAPASSSSSGHRRCEGEEIDGYPV